MMKKTNSGFTLIETMIAVSILALAVAGPLVTASRALVAANTARDQLTASYLAQEAVEYVRLMRDNTFLETRAGGGSSADAWANFVSGSLAGSITACRASACTLDPARAMGTGSGFALAACSGASCTPLYLANGIYTQQSNIAGATQTLFTRTVQATDVSATDERITATVTWNSHGTQFTITVTDHLTPWQ